MLVIQSKTNHRYRIARWALCLQSYDFEIVHKMPGKANANVDTLSRMHDNASVQSKLMSENQLNVPDKKKVMEGSENEHET